MQFYLPTQDDWSPNFIRNTVRVSVYEADAIWDGKPGTHARISVWGADDRGMEKDFALKGDKAVRQKQMGEIIKEAQSFPNPLNKDWLLAHGFNYA